MVTNMGLGCDHMALQVMVSSYQVVVGVLLDGTRLVPGTSKRPGWTGW